MTPALFLFEKKNKIKLTGNPHFKDYNIKRKSCLIYPFSHPQIHPCLGIDVCEHREPE